MGSILIHIRSKQAGRAWRGMTSTPVIPGWNFRPLPEDAIRWPEELPVPLVDGYGVAPEDRRSRAEFDIGSHARVVFDTDETAASVLIVLESELSHLFETFERDVLKQGSQWFVMPLWVAGQMADHLVRFRTRPEQNGRMGEETTHYSFELDISWRQGLMDEDLTIFLVENDPYEFMRFEDLLQIVVNEKYPRSLPFGRNYW